MVAVVPVLSVTSVLVGAVSVVATGMLTVADKINMPMIDEIADSPGGDPGEVVNPGSAGPDLTCSNVYMNGNTVIVYVHAGVVPGNYVVGADELEASHSGKADGSTNASSFVDLRTAPGVLIDTG